MEENNNYLDTEFHEYSKYGVDTIELISIGIAKDTGDTYYAICNEFDVGAAFDNEWLRTNVLFPIFKECTTDKTLLKNFSKGSLQKAIEVYGKSRKQIASEVVAFVGNSPDFYGFYCYYDCVVLCWLYGRMIDLPTSWPMYCNDIKQTIEEMQKHTVDSVYAKAFYYKNESHNALKDALQIRDAKAVLDTLFKLEPIG